MTSGFDPNGARERAHHLVTPDGLTQLVEKDLIVESSGGASSIGLKLALIIELAPIERIALLPHLG